MATVIVSNSMDTVTARAAQLGAMLAVARVSPDAFEALNPDDQTTYLWACSEMAEQLKAAAAGAVVRC